ncbi:LOW QUALITY PROTEIN: hypothetical protein ACHAW6_000501, partial [Cyclotella cf. meneghiniana]
KCDSNGVLVDIVHKQPAIDTCVYEVPFPDGCTKDLATNTIAEALYAQCDPDGNHYVMLDAIVDYRKNPNLAFSRNDQVNSLMVVSCSTCGWELCCEWKDRSTSWQELLDLKETLFRLLSLHLPRALLMNQPSTGGCLGSSRRETELSPWLSYKAQDTTRGPTSLILSSPKCGRGLQN